MPSTTLSGAAKNMTMPMPAMKSMGMALMTRPVQSIALEVAGVGASVVMVFPVREGKRSGLVVSIEITAGFVNTAAKAAPTSLHENDNSGQQILYPARSGALAD